MLVLNDMFNTILHGDSIIHGRFIIFINWQNKIIYK